MAAHIFHSASMEKVATWISLMVLFMTLQGVVAEVFRGFHDIRLASLFGGVLTSLFSALAFLIVWLMQGYGSLELALKLSVGSAALSLAISSTMLASKVSPLNGDGNIEWTELWRTGWPLAVSSLTVMLAMQGDLWVVGAMLGEKDAAVYGVALRLLALMTMAHGLAVSVVQSSVAELYGQGKLKTMERLVQNASFVACVVAGVVLLVLALGGKWLISTVFGPAYLSAYGPLMVLGGGQFVGMWFGLTEMVLIMCGRQHVVMWILLCNTFLGLMLAILFAPRYGSLGVACAWALLAIVEGASTWGIVRIMFGTSCHVNPIIWLRAEWRAGVRP